MDRLPLDHQVIEESLGSYQDPAEQTVMFFDDTFTCPIAGCHRVFANTQTYRKHRAKTHGLPRFNCIACRLPFDSHHDLIKHMYQENHMVACTVCDLKFRRPGEATCHYNQRHKQFTCCYCSVNIKGQANLKTHLQVHNEEQSPYDAALFVEVATDSSFAGSLYGLPSETQVIQDSDGTGTEYLPVVLEDDDSNVAPDSTSYTPPTTPRVLVQIADSSARTCSDTDTAETESASDTELAPTNSFSYGIGECAGSSEAVVFGPGASDLFGGNSLDQFTPINSLEPVSLASNEVTVLSSDPSSLTNEEVTVFSPNPSSQANKEDDAIEWIGHNVDMYQSMSEKHKKTYRYNCSKCSCTFKNKDILKRHLNIHDFVCKHCFLRFNSSSEYKSHLHDQHSKPQNFQCSVCSHILQGLKSLMVHEMKHRLNLAFKREAEDVVQLDVRPRTQLEYFECRFCKELVKGFSKFVRHTVWHNWESMWNTYVLGRIFKGSFTEEDAKKYGKEVAEKLAMKWRDCGVKVISTKTWAISEIPMDKRDAKNVADQVDASVAAIQTNIIDGIVANNLAEESTSKSSKDSDDEETDSGSETEAGTSVCAKGWMNYWYSYLGIDGTPPSWLKPIMKNLLVRWKSFKPDECDPLYKQMDQLGMMIRAQKYDSLDGPTVLVERLPMSHFNPKKVHNSLVESKQRRIIEMTDDAAVSKGTLSTPNSTINNKMQGKTFSLIKNSSGPASGKRMATSPLTSPKHLRKLKKDLSEKGPNKAINSFIKCLNAERVQVWKRRLSARVNLGNKGATYESPKPPPRLDMHKNLGDQMSQTPPGSHLQEKVHKDCPSTPASSTNEATGFKGPKSHPQLDTHEDSCDQNNPTPPDSPLPAKVRKHSLSAGLNSRNEGTAHETSKRQPQLDTLEKLGDEGSLPGSPLSVKECNIGMKRPLVILSRLDWKKPGICCGSSLPSTSDFHQMVAWTQKETGSQKIPHWATSLIESVCKNSLPQSQKMLKMQQVVSLIKMECDGDESTAQMAVVEVERLPNL